ncbi:MAG: response regulator [Legionellales bacterium]
MAKDNNSQNLYLENILNAKLPVSIYWMNTDGVVLGCNEEQAHMFGFPSSKEFIGKSAYDLRELLGWSDEMCEAIRQNDLLVMETGEAIVTEEIMYARGKNRTYLTHKSPLINDKGEVIGVFGFSSDITERKEAEEALKNAKETAEIASVSKFKFIGKMSHDIRMLLQSIISMSDQIDRVSVEKITQACAQDIHQSGNELLRLLDKFIESLDIKMPKNPKLEKKPNQKSSQVLLIEDTLVSRKVIEYLLKKEGLEVVAVQTASEAIKKLSQQNFDFILVDMDLINENSLETIKAIRKNAKEQTFIVAMTKSIDPQIKTAYLELGIQEVIDKPLNLEKIKVIVAKNNSVFNLSAVVQAMGGDTQLAKELLNMLMQELPKFKQEITDAFKKQDWEAVQHHVHKLHGGLCYCGVLKLKDVTRDFEKQLIEKTGSYDKAYRLLLKEIDTTLTAYHAKSC